MTETNPSPHPAKWTPLINEKDISEWGDIFSIQSMFSNLFYWNDRSFKQEVLTGLAACYMIARRLLISIGGASISRTLPWDCPTVPAPIIIPTPTTSSHSGISSKVEKFFVDWVFFQPQSVSWLGNPTRLALLHRSQLAIVCTWHGKEMVWQTLSSKSDDPIEDWNWPMDVTID